MNKELLEDQWVEVKEFIREKFSSLTEEDIRQIDGHYDQLVARLQQRYGFSREQAEAEIRKWAPDFNSIRSSREVPKYASTRDESSYYAKDRASYSDYPENRESGNSSLFKWLLLAGIPLLFLLGYLANQASTPVSSTTDEFVMISETPTDQVFSQNIRRSLASNEALARNLDAVRITSSNGVVNLNGFVSTNEQRDAIAKYIQNIQGVKQVNNRLQVR